MSGRFLLVPVVASLGLWLYGSHAGAATAEPVALPVDFRCDRFYVEPQTANGAILRLYTDTGGGLWLSKAAVQRLELDVVSLSEGDREMQFAALPKFAPGKGIPALDPDSDPRSGPAKGRLVVMPQDPPADFGDGMLGQDWFAGRRWTFDYANGQLLVGAAPIDEKQAHVVPLGFPKDESGRRKANFPSIVATVEGVELPFLFDTGATISSSAEAALAIGVEGASECATSFIVASVFEAWRQAHPDWRVVENADVRGGASKGEAMIEVPEVTIAGHTVGPVWFTRRADPNFHEYMSSFMDRKVDGALGGSLLRWFVVDVDYPGALARFTRIPEPKATPGG
ncbi:MAG: hypothetical protein AB7E72_09680 [Lysobacterales bacterium]